jgi:hypothetical protein
MEESIIMEPSPTPPEPPNIHLKGWTSLLDDGTEAGGKTMENPGQTILSQLTFVFNKEEPQIKDILVTKLYKFLIKIAPQNQKVHSTA